jgi:hypothetical protein
MGYKSTKACSKTDKPQQQSGQKIKRTHETLKKTTVREELEYWNAVFVLRRLNDYFKSHHGYDRGLQGLTAEDFSMMVIEKVITNERSWLDSKETNFVNFCTSIMSSELYNFRHSPNYNKTVSYSEIGEIYKLGKRNRWERNGLGDEFDGF